MAKEWEVGEEMTNSVGSLCYRAPELLLGATIYGYAVDVWALGCIFYCMRVGRTLFRGDGELEQLQAIVHRLGLDRSSISDEVVLSTLDRWAVTDRIGSWSLPHQSIS